MYVKMRMDIKGEDQAAVVFYLTLPELKVIPLPCRPSSRKSEPWPPTSPRSDTSDLLCNVREITPHPPHQFLFLVLKGLSNSVTSISLSLVVFREMPLMLLMLCMLLPLLKPPNWLVLPKTPCGMVVSLFLLISLSRPMYWRLLEGTTLLLKAPPALCV